MKRRYELFVGFRYIRSRGQNRFISFISLISMLGIALGVAVLIVVLSVMNGFEKELREKILSMTSHATITGADNRVQDWQALEAGARRHAQVVDTAPFVEGQGMLVSDKTHSGVLVHGILPEREGNVAGVSAHISRAELEALESRSYKILLGVDLAEALSVGAGDRVILIIAKGNVTPAGIIPRMRRFTVAGIFEAGMYEYDRNMAFIHMEDAARLYQFGDDVSGIRLSLQDMFQAPAVVREIAIGLGDFYINDWTRQHSNFFKSIHLTKRIMFMILLLVVAVAAFNIVSTLVMVVRDKRADIAILRTVGADPRGIMKIFMVQGTVIGIVGTLIGLVLGVVLAVNIEVLVRGLESLLDTDLLNAEVYFIGDLPAHVQWDDVLKICATAFFLSILSTIYPALQAARTQPAEALRYDY